jgi:hypothetical protein
MVRVALGSLPAGTYNVTSYHLDPDNSQCADIRILVTDANGFAVEAAVRGDASLPALPAAGGLTTSLVDSKSVRFTVTSNGVDEVMIYFDGTFASDTEVPLDALWLTLAAPSEIIEIVNVEMTVAGGTASVAIDFTSTPGSTYRIRVSPDLVAWSNLATNYPSAGTLTTFTESGIPLGTARRFYQINRN